MTSKTTTCRDIDELASVAQTACKLLFQECFKAGITDIFITETFRSQERQDYLYAQGRTRPGQIVTWTKSSNHKSRLAWDIAISPPKTLYDNATLSMVGAIAKKLGITWGGTWTKNIDRPHFEVKSNWKIPKGYKLEGEVIIPTSSNKRVELIIEDKEEDEDIMKFTNSTPKKAIRDELSQYVEKGYIDKSWLAKFDNGSMTNGDYSGIRLIAQQRKNKK